MERELTPTLAFLVEYLDLPEAVGDPDARWETFQLKHLNNPSLLAIELKSRQVGWSWLAAAEAVASAILYPRIPHIFVSINQEEAGEKIRYAKSVLEALDRDVRPGLIIDNRYEMEFPNGARLISHPCRPPRGKAKAKIYLDEFAHYPNDKEIYQAALPTLSKGGFIRIGSSPLGARGTFWEIFTESMRPYPGYVRASIPWWEVGAMCTNVREASREAPGMPTENRVAKYGSPRLLVIFENMPLDDFQQEYECAWLDEAVSWLDWELIKRNQVLAQQDRLLYYRAKHVGPAMQAVDDLRAAIAAGKIEDVLVGGMDIGRHKDTTEIILLSRNPYANNLPYRLHITLDRVEFDDQRAVADKLLRDLPITQFLIDTNGIGMQLAEQLSSSHPAAQPFMFTGPSKELLAIEVKLRAQRAEVPIPLDREFSYQLHSIRKRVTAAKNFIFDVDASERHHADMFWAWALAIWAGQSDGARNTVDESPLLGYRG